MQYRLVVMSVCLFGAHALAQTPQRAAVMPLKAKRVAPEVTAVLDDLLLVALAEAGRLSVIGPQELDALLANEGLKDSIGCDNVTCAAEIGGALDARYVVSGSVGRLGDNVVVSLTLFDTESMQASSRAKVTTTNDENVFEVAIRDAVARLLGVATPTTPTPTIDEPVSEPAKQEVVAATGPGSLVIDSTPAGARVLIDDREVGVTPLTLADLAAGIVAVDFEKERHEAQRVYATVHPGRESHVLATLPAWGTLRITGTDQAEVLVDGQSLGRVPFESQLAPGSHAVSVRHPEHAPWTEDVSVEVGEHLERDVRLTSRANIDAERTSHVLWGILSLTAGIGFGALTVYAAIISEAEADEPDVARRWEALTYSAALFSLLGFVFAYDFFNSMPAAPGDEPALALRALAGPGALALELRY